MHHPPGPGTPTDRHISNSPVTAPSSFSSSLSHNGGGGGAAGGPAYSAALRGASLAFQRTTPRPTPKPNPGQPQPQQRSTNTTKDGNNESDALIAATSASRDHSLSRSSPIQAARNNTGHISRQTTGSSSSSLALAGEGNHGQGNEQNNGGFNNQRPIQRSATSQKQQQNPYSTSRSGAGAGAGAGPSSLKPPGLAPMGPDPRSPSFIAATLAASRSASPNRREQKQQQPTTPTMTHHPYAQQAATRVQRKESTGTRNHSAASSVTDLDLTDTTPIPPTNALISMFEKKDTTGPDAADPVKKATGTEPVKKAASRLRPITPPRAGSPLAKPEVSSSMLASTLAWERATSPPASVSGTKSAASPASCADRLEVKKRPPTPPAKGKKLVEAAKVPEPEDVGTRRKPRAATPPRSASKLEETVILSPRPRRVASHKVILQDDLGQEEKTGGNADTDGNMSLESVNPGSRPSSAKTTRVVNKPQPSPSRPRRSSSTFSEDTFVSASSAPSPTRGSPRRRLSRAASPKSPIIRSPAHRPASVQSLPTRPSHQKQAPPPPPAPPRRLQAQPTIPLTSLTNATMAGILASSRASPSTASPPPPLPPPRKQTTPHMRQTLRKPPKSDDEEEKGKNRHKKNHLGNKKKHAHHEGARRRWREQITERERKRYEGVWASNRGLLLSPSSFPVIAPPPSSGTPANANTSSLPFDRRPSYYSYNNNNKTTSTPPTPNPADFVANVVARDIWSRSRLPFDELAEVWDLVDSRGMGALDKTEFVVGMWLIDQRLRGRKIPQKVSESVWSSAKGVRVPAPPAADRGHRRKK